MYKKVWHISSVLTFVVKLNIFCLCAADTLGISGYKLKLRCLCCKRATFSKVLHYSAIVKCFVLISRRHNDFL